MASLPFAGSVKPSTRPRHGCGSPSPFSGPHSRCPMVADRCWTCWHGHASAASTSGCCSGAPMMRPHSCEPMLSGGRPNISRCWNSRHRESMFGGIARTQASASTRNSGSSTPASKRPRRLWAASTSIPTRWLGPAIAVPGRITMSLSRSAGRQSRTCTTTSCSAGTRRANGRRQAVVGALMPMAISHFQAGWHRPADPPLPRCSARSIAAATPTPIPPRRGAVCHRRRRVLHSRPVRHRHPLGA